MTSVLAPVLLFVYNRPNQTQKTLEALSANKLARNSDLFIFSDGAKEGATRSELENIESVRKVIRSTQWCRSVTIIESERNKGLAQSIINGVSDKVDTHGKAIILEDDLVTAHGFLQYMNQALDLYESERRVMQISGHQFPIGIPASKCSFFLPLTTSWGWGTWKRAWDSFDPNASGYEALKSDAQLSGKFDLDNSYSYSSMLLSQMETKKIDSWAIRWWWTVFQENGLSLFPDKSLVKNIGFGTDASHTKGNDPFGSETFSREYMIEEFPTDINEHTEYMKLIQDLLKTKSKAKPSALKKLISFVKSRIA